MNIGVLTLCLYMPLCHSLKEKRSVVKPILARLHREFNISAAEIDMLDKWQGTVIACVIVSNDRKYSQMILQKLMGFFENNWPDLHIIDHHIEMI